MKKIQTTILAFALFFSVLPAFSMPPNIWLPEAEAAKLQTWLKDTSQKIKTQKRFGTFTKSLKDKRIYCTCQIDNNGYCTNLKVAGKASSAPLAEEALNLIRTTSPLSTPPSKLPIEKGLLFSFGCSGELEVSILPFKSWGTHRFE